MKTQLMLRKSGGAVIVSLPKTVLEILHLQVGSILNLTLENHKITLTPAKSQQTLEGLLANCRKEKFVLSAEDRAWVRAKTKGREL